MKVKVGNKGEVSLTEKNYLASGGQAKVYKKDKYAFKIYVDGNTDKINPKAMIPLDKIKELSAITEKNVLKPLDIIFDSKGKAIGYTMAFVSDSHPLCKLFTKNFKKRYKVGPQDIVSLVKRMQETVQKIHASHCVVADMNEMNILVANKLREPVFIDVDSYQTPSYKATAIMDSVRDRTLPFGVFNELSDWFSFGVLAFQLYINIHPYRGSHPNYKPTEWSKRMDDGISVFDKDVSVPPIANDFSVIPKPHLEWMKSLFVKGERSIPPFPDASGVFAVPIQPVVIIESKGDFEVVKIYTFDSEVREIFNMLGVGYVVTEKSIYKGDRKVITDLQEYDRVLLCESSGMVPVVAKLKGEVVTLEDMKGSPIGGELRSKNIFYKDGAIYTVDGGRLQQHTFREVSGKIFPNTMTIGNVLELSSKIFEGCIYQDVLGKPWFQIPYDGDKCFFRHIPELDGYRIVDARSEDRYLMVMARQKGIYSRFVFVFDNNMDSYTVRIEKDIDIDTVNFTVLNSGVALHVSESSGIELFADNKKVKTLKNAPFDSSMKLKATIKGVYFADGNTVYSAKMKKGG